VTIRSRLHPYPAMLPDRLADAIAARFVERGMAVLDPFCGTGRSLLAAAAQGADCTGTDVNPLACLVTMAKTCRLSQQRLHHLARDAKNRPDYEGPEIPTRPWGAHVDWFDGSTVRELSQIVGWINGRKRATPEVILLSAVLSATTRAVSFARLSSWKLHRMSASDRQRWQPSAWQVFSDRLSAVAERPMNLPDSAGSVRCWLADVLDLPRHLGEHSRTGHFDLVFTSPPYGDSRTTVQYGALSRLCLTAVRHINGLPLEIEMVSETDARALGGPASPSSASGTGTADLKPYWHGGRGNEARMRVARFSSGMCDAIDIVAEVCAPRSRVVMVVGRRLAGGWRLRLDDLVRDRLAYHGFREDGSWRRRIGPKLTPRKVNSRGGTKAGAARVVPTMSEEFIVVMRRG
jgi:site-specific DNA-methyltransferase (cytosine-N4-specific)